MTLTSEFINHKRLGDLVIPGSHNAGSYGCNASDFTLVKKKAVFVTIEDIVPQVQLIKIFQMKNLIDVLSFLNYFFSDTCRLFSLSVRRSLHTVGVWLPPF